MSFCSSLRPLDIEFMKRLSKVVNIVPVIAKADTLTLEERVYFKQRVGPASAPPPPPWEGSSDTAGLSLLPCCPASGCCPSRRACPRPFLPKRPHARAAWGP